MGRIFKYAKTELQYSGMTAKPKFMYIEDLPEQEGELTYNGEEQFPTWKNLDPLKVLIEGEKSATNAGEHFITVTPTGNFAWPDNTQSPKSVTYIIKRKKVTTIPSQKGTLTFNNSQQTPTWNNFNAQELKIGGVYQNQTHANTYTATFTPDDNHCWSDETYSAKNVTWQIKVLTLAKPSATTTSYAYTGQNIDLIVTNYNSNYMTQSGTIRASANGKYTATYKLLSTTDTTWSDNTTTDVNITWEIGKRTIPSIMTNNVYLTYSGSAQEPEWTNYDSTYITKTGISQVNAGTYSTIFKLKDKTNTQWPNGSTDDIVVYWVIQKKEIARVTKPTTNLTYSGSAQEPAWGNYDSTYITKEGDVNKVNAGSYSTTFKLKDKTNTQWSNRSTDDIVISWTIGKKELPAPSEKTSPTYSSFNIFPYHAEWNDYDTSKMSISEEAYKDAGNYTATFTITDNNYIFPYNLTTATAKWHILKAKIDEKPYLDDGTNTVTKTWSESMTDTTVGQLMQNSFNKLDWSCMGKPSIWDEKLTKVGSYYVNIGPDSNHTWADGSISSVRFILHIDAAAAPEWIDVSAVPYGADPAKYNYGQSRGTDDTLYMRTIPINTTAALKCYFVVPKDWEIYGNISGYGFVALGSLGTPYKATLPGRTIASGATGYCVEFNTNGVRSVDHPELGISYLTVTLKRDNYVRTTYCIGTFKTQ